MTRPEIINALREAIALLEAGDKALARPVLERRPAEPPASDEDRRTFRQANVLFVDHGVSKASGKPWGRLTLVSRDSDGEQVREKFPTFDEDLIDKIQLLGKGDEVAITCRPRRNRDGEQEWVMLTCELVTKAPRRQGRSWTPSTTSRSDPFLPCAAPTARPSRSRHAWSCAAALAPGGGGVFTEDAWTRKQDSRSRRSASPTPSPSCGRPWSTGSSAGARR
jgi:hypothetical protein